MALVIIIQLLKLKKTVDMLPKLTNNDSEEEFKLPDLKRSATIKNTAEKRKHLALKLNPCSRKKSWVLMIGKPDCVRRYNIDKDYEVGRKLGIGSYSHVFEGTKKDSGERVAIKKSKGKTNISRLEQEYDLLKSLRHKNIPKVFDFKVDHATNSGYIIMEYFDGVPVDEYVSENGVLNYEQANNWIYELLDAIYYLHGKGIVHRDVKPQNVLVNSSSSIMLIDFNISKIVKASLKGDESRISMISFKLMTQVGSPMFAAPEVYSNDCYTEKIDVWGIGIVLLHLILANEYIPKKFQDFSSEGLEPVIENFLHGTLWADPNRRLSINDCREHDFFIDKFSKAESETTGLNQDEWSNV